ncbi:UNVERIFIED_CONTAM: hypothetical protein Sangu_1702400 [Sesamum angustifolium]|uniref:Uncharacterized protein n=1 Tax=Sesamum angustifolium TaxID=2727405 RepID=A0AAW2MLB3_9LAMI
MLVSSRDRTEVDEHDGQAALQGQDQYNRSHLGLGDDKKCASRANMPHPAVPPRKPHASHDD